MGLFRFSKTLFVSLLLAFSLAGAMLLSACGTDSSVKPSGLSASVTSAQPANKAANNQNSNANVNANSNVNANANANTNATANKAAANTANENANKPAEKAPDAHSYVLNTNTKKFHRPGCKSINSMKDKNRQDVDDVTRDSVIARGYVPCKICNP